VVGWKLREAVLEIEVPGTGFGVYDDSPGCNLPGATQCPLQSVQQKELAPPLALQTLSNGHAPQKRNSRPPAKPTRGGMKREPLLV